MPLVSFGDFGVQDKELYQVYLRANVQYAEYTQGKGSDAWRSMALQYAGVRDVFEQRVDGLVGGRGDEQFARSSDGEFGFERGGDGSVGGTVREVFIGSGEGSGDGSVRVVREASGGSGVSGRESGAIDCVSEVVKGYECPREGDAERVRGKNWKKNQRRKANRRGQINVDTGSDLGSSDSVRKFGINVDTGSRNFERNVGCSLEKTPLRKSLEEKWRVENELRIAKAKKELDLLQSEDRDAIKKLRDRKVQGATERTMVQIEKAHASLVQTGNVPGVQPVQQGFCRTVVDGEIVESVPGLSGGESKECSISPSSSISEREVRQLKKDFEDLKLKCDMLERREKRMGLAYDVLGGKEHVAVSVVDGSVPESARQVLDKVCGKGEWEAVGDLDMDPDTLYLQMDYSNKFDYGGCY